MLEVIECVGRKAACLPAVLFFLFITTPATQLGQSKALMEKTRFACHLRGCRGPQISQCFFAFIFFAFCAAAATNDFSNKMRKNCKARNRAYLVTSLSERGKERGERKKEGKLPMIENIEYQEAKDYNNFTVAFAFVPNSKSCRSIGWPLSCRDTQKEVLVCCCCCCCSSDPLWKEYLDSHPIDILIIKKPFFRLQAFFFCLTSLVLFFSTRFILFSYLLFF